MAERTEGPLTSGLTREDADARATQLIADAIREGLDARERFSLVVTGGRSPVGIYDRLATLTLEWNRVDFYWSDERAVGPADADSNYRLVHEHLLSKCEHDPSRVFRMHGEMRPLPAAADSYERTLHEHLGSDPIDFALLGMGEDGHIASLFPGRAEQSVDDRWVVPVSDSPKPPSERLSLTIPRLSATRRILVFTSGSGREQIIRRVLEDPEGSRLRWPVARLPAARTHFIVARDG